VEVREEGRQRRYRLNGEALKPIHDWVSGFAQTWDERYDALDVVLSELKLKAKEQDDGGSDQ
jgi:hypothetical protein